MSQVEKSRKPFALMMTCTYTVCTLIYCISRFLSFRCFFSFSCHFLVSHRLVSCVFVLFLTRNKENFLLECKADYDLLSPPCLMCGAAVGYPYTNIFRPVNSTSHVHEDRCKHHLTAPTRTQTNTVWLDITLLLAVSTSNRSKHDD